MGLFARLKAGLLGWELNGLWYSMLAYLLKIFSVKPILLCICVFPLDGVLFHDPKFQCDIAVFCHELELKF
jgi:hypothetical protein